MLPPLINAHVWLSPAAIAATPLLRPLTSTGTELSVAAAAPALDGAAARQRARMQAAGAYCGDPAAQAAHVHRRGAVRGRAVPELTDVVVAPTLGRAAAGQRARMVAAGADRRDP